MALIATFAGDTVVKLPGLWQYDYGQTLEVHGLTGLPASTPVHFGVESALTTETRMGTVAGDVLTVPIPDAMLAQASPFWAYIYATDGESGQTLWAIRIELRRRPAPSTAVTEEQQSAFDQLVATVNGLITAVGEVNETATASAGAAADSADDAAASAELALNNILNGIGTHNASDAAHPDIREDIRQVEAIARGRATGYVFDTYEDMIAWLADSDHVTQLIIGDNLYIRDTGVKDYWWDGATYQTLEAENPDLTDYYTKAQADALLPILITRADYDALVAAGTVQADRLYDIIEDES